MTEEMNEMTDEEKQLSEEQIEFNGLSPEMQVNVIITDMMATVDRLIEMRFVLNQILMANPPFCIEFDGETTILHTI